MLLELDPIKIIKLPCCNGKYGHFPNCVTFIKPSRRLYGMISKTLLGSWNVQLFKNEKERDKSFLYITEQVGPYCVHAQKIDLDGIMI